MTVTWDARPVRVDKARHSLSPGGATVFWFFVVETISIVFLQKFGIPFGDQIVELSLPLVYAGMVVMAFSNRIRIEPIRVLLYFVFALLFVGSNILRGGEFSVNSVYLTLAIYLPFVMYFEVDAPIYMRCMGFFVNAMIAAGGLEVLQHLLQLTLGWHSWIDVNALTPTQYLMPNFAYVQPIFYGSQYAKPNAFLFLEVSVLSQFLALAFAIEYVYFKRFWKLAFLAICILLTFAGTGLLLVLVCFPVIVGRVSARTMLGILAVAVVVFFVGLKVGWYEQVHHRFGEFTRVNSSGHHRFVMPLEEMINFAHKPDSLYSGIGAGAIIKDPNFVWWPVAKVTLENGFLVAFAFFAFLIHACYVQAPSKRIAFAVLVYYNLLGGGFAIPFYAFTCLLLCSLFRVRKEAPPTARSRPGDGRRTGDAAPRRPIGSPNPA